MIYREQGFLAVVCFGSSPTPSPSPVSKFLSLSVFLCVAGRAYWLERGDVGGGGGAKSYDGEKAWSSINHSILSGSKHHLYPVDFVQVLEHPGVLWQSDAEPQSWHRPDGQHQPRALRWDSFAGNYSLIKRDTRISILFFSYWKG